MSFLDGVFDAGKQFLGGIAPMAGRLIGARFGGPLGSALGGGLGDMVGNALSGSSSSQPSQPPQFPTPRGPSMAGNPFGGQSSSPFGSSYQSPTSFPGYSNNQNPSQSQYGSNYGSNYGSSYDQQPQNPFNNFGSNMGGRIQNGIDRYMPPQYQFSTPNSLGSDFGNYMSNGIDRSSSPLRGFGRTIGQGASDLYNRYITPNIPSQYGNVPFNNLGNSMGQGMSNGLESRFNSYANGPRWYDQGMQPQQPQYYPGTDNNYQGVGQYSGYDSPIGAGEGFVRGYGGRFGQGDQSMNSPMAIPPAPPLSSLGLDSQSPLSPYTTVNRRIPPTMPSNSGFNGGSQPSDDYQARLEKLRQARSRMEGNRFAEGGYVPRRTLRDMTEMFGALEHLPEMEQQGAYQ
jgi:hypothetical protein